MQLYHLSLNLEKSLTRTFCPRVPISAAIGEDGKIPRICFSKSIIGCVNAMPEWNLFHAPKNGSEGILVKAVLFSMDSEDIAPGFFLDSSTLYEKKLVPDAAATQECWCLEPVQLTGKIVEIFIPTDYSPATLYCARENQRDLVYSVIDRNCNNYAQTHRDTLEQMSLFRIVNYPT